MTVPRDSTPPAPDDDSNSTPQGHSAPPRWGPWIVAFVLVVIGVTAIEASRLVQSAVLAVAGNEVIAHVQDVSLEHVDMRSGVATVEHTATFEYELPDGSREQLVYEYSGDSLDAWETLRIGDEHRLLSPPVDLFEPVPASELHVRFLPLGFGLALVAVGVRLPRLVASTRQS